MYYLHYDKMVTLNLDAALNTAFRVSINVVRFAR